MALVINIFAWHLRILPLPEFLMPFVEFKCHLAGSIVAPIFGHDQELLLIRYQSTRCTIFVDSSSHLKKAHKQSDTSKNWLSGLVLPVRDLQGVCCSHWAYMIKSICFSLSQTNDIFNASCPSGTGFY